MTILVLDGPQVATQDDQVVSRASTAAGHEQPMTMATRRILALALVAGLSMGSWLGTRVSGQENGAIGGKATSEAKRPYSDYQVLLRDPSTGQVVRVVPLGTEAQFSFSGVTLSRRLLVELLNTKTNRIVCTEGPYTLTTAAPVRNDVNINCGSTPAAWWLMLAGAGAVSGIALLEASGG